MQFAVCRHNTVLSELNVHEAAVEFFNCEPISHLGYEVIAIDDEDNIHKVAVVDGKVELLPITLAEICMPSKETALQRFDREVAESFQ